MGFIMTSLHMHAMYFDHIHPLYYPFSSLLLLSPFTSLIVRLSLDAKDGTLEGTLTFASRDHLNCQKSPHISLG